MAYEDGGVVDCFTVPGIKKISTPNLDADFFI